MSYIIVSCTHFIFIIESENVDEFYSLLNY